MNKTRTKSYLLFMTLLMISSFLVLGCAGCGGVKEKQISLEYHAIRDMEENSNSTKLLADYRSSIFPIQSDTATFHYFKDIKLKKYKSINGAYSSWGTSEFTYSEMYPYILNKRRTQGSKAVEIIYYDSTRQNIINRVDILSLNPYTGKYKNIELGYPSFEYFEKIHDNEKHIYENAKPEKYITFYDGGFAGMNGYAYIIFCLTGVMENKILSWESTIVILDKEGNILSSIREPNQTSTVVISEDASTIAYKYGNHSGNPYDDAPNGEVRLRDTKTQSIIYKAEPKLGYQVGLSVSSINSNILDIGYEKVNRLEKDSVILEFIDMSSKTIYRKALSYSSYLEALKKAKCGSCLYESLDFELDKI